MPIRRGDGVSLAPKHFQEVRKGDGTVLWTAGATVVQIDGHEDNDVVEYSNTTNFTTTSTSLAGTYSAKVSSSSVDEQMYSMPGDGLSTYPERGTRWGFQLDNLGGLFAGHSFGMELAAASLNDSKTYHARVNERDGEIQLNRGNGDGTGTQLAVAAFSTTETPPYYGEVVYPTLGNPIEVTVWDSTDTQLASVSAVDDNYSGQGIGWSRGGGSATSPRFDNDPNYS